MNTEPVEPKIGWLYRIRSRNLTLGVFTGDGFIGIREKFGEHYLFKEYYLQTAFPIEELEQCPESINLNERLNPELHAYLSSVAQQ